MRAKNNEVSRWILTKVSACMLASGLIVVVPSGLAFAQHSSVVQSSPDTAPHRTRLILKDGSYQIVMSYRVVGSIVHYVSAERGGAEEEIPVSLVDLDATHRWEKQHT